MTPSQDGKAWGAGVGTQPCPGNAASSGCWPPGTVGVTRASCPPARWASARPAALMPLLEYCSVRPDPAVASHHFFGPDAEIR